ncbi:MAG: hypothetical protein H0T91_07145 [Propionibacteriaceae bacterium]|nr:hypothetical protein [Propionibacteriaceae bacterium]
MVAADGGLEAALAKTEEQVDSALKATAALTRELKKAKHGAARGQLRDLRRALSAAAGLAGQASRATESTAASFDLDEEEHLASGSYAKELLEAAAEQDVAMFEADERLLCYPSLIRVLPSDAAVEIDRRREKRLRPSVLVGLLAAAQARPPRFRPEPFLESLASAYDLVRSREQQRDGSVVRLVDIWGVLTLLPGQQRDYTRPEFARDLYLLDASGVSTVKFGRELRWHASSGTRGSGTLTTVAQTGQQQLYWGISFAARS